MNNLRALWAAKAINNFSRDSKIVSGVLLEKQIGHGLTARVYKGTEFDGNRSVAVKIVDFRRSKYENIALREAQLHDNLDHKNIVKIYKFYTRDNCLILHMELVDGRNMEDLITRKRVFEKQEIGRIIRQLGSVVHYLHSGNVVHGDLHPGNIMFDHNGNVKVIDFGAASTDLSQKYLDLQKLSQLEMLLAMHGERSEAIAIRQMMLSNNSRSD